jgi:hypothetical protein
MEIEELLRQTSSEFPYPPTPDINRLVSEKLARKPGRIDLRKAGWVMALISLILIGLMAVPPVRAAVLDFIQVGAIRIIFQPPTSIPAGSQEPPPPLAVGAEASPVEAIDLLGLADGQMTLEGAERLSGFPLSGLLYPQSLGPPDRVFYQDLNGAVVGLIWLDEATLSHVQTSLLLIDPDVFISKDAPSIVDSVQVGDYPGTWLSGEHFLLLRQHGGDLGMLITGNVLIWDMNGITYRLETDSAQEEALAIASELIGGTK